jgi:hypothetical protein
MRLLRLQNDGEYGLAQEFGKNIPHYAILSHTWGEDDEEVSFKDIKKRRRKNTSGYSKIVFCGRQAAKDGLDYF